MRVLFILKKQGLYAEYGYSITGSGLYNSAIFCVDMLNNILGFDVKIVLVDDNNGIDREVAAFRPEIVIIESLWVVPTKFPILTALYPKVTWIVRNHSAIPFLAHEGNAMNWLLKYAITGGVLIAHNDQQTLKSFNDLTGTQGLSLPNYYPTNIEHSKPRYKNQSTIHVGCFGAIRLQKNQLLQAVAAIRYANAKRKNLVFHINSSRVEGGDNILKNIQALFSVYPQHELQEHQWLAREDFLSLMRTMDAHMQVSMSETFNIVTADAVVNNVPVVVSREIPWVEKKFQAKTTDCRDIINRLDLALTNRRDRRGNINNLYERSNQAVSAWQDALAAI